ncbi:cell division FtsZ family protein [Candidatus Parcubacteria bacterium]|nr:cell division FtsZ family protein [Patescibacteria group bacterium]MBU4466678.1 cell division FtsZ family protein [Patescibacteria group bacterium]MCG2688412.1 cell division FtsZ family protein [Candidatus Parcubacteria bacterium]
MAKSKKAKIRKKKTLVVKKKKQVSLNIKEARLIQSLGQKRVRIKVIGIGDGGAAIVADLAKTLDKVDFWVANTDWRRFQKFPPVVKILNFGEKQTHGVGTGMDPEIGRQAALAEKEKIIKVLKDTDLCFLISSLGGGTGSGATPIFAKIAQQQGIMTFGIFTLPFKFEGERKARIAKEALDKMRSNLNTSLVFPNEKIFQSLDKNISFNEGFAAINKVLAEGLRGLIGLVFQPGLINIDFADLKAVLDSKGKPAYLANAEFEKGAKIEEIKKKIFQNVFLAYNFRQAKSVLFNIVSDANLALGEVSEVSQLVFNAVHSDAKIIFGVSFDKKLSGKIMVTILAIGGREKSFISSVKKTQKPQNPKKPKKNKNTKKEPPAKIEVKIRRNAIQVKEEVKAEEEDIAAKERIWETPTILRTLLRKNLDSR